MPQSWFMLSDYWLILSCAVLVFSKWFENNENTYLNIPLSQINFCVQILAILKIGKTNIYKRFKCGFLGILIAPLCQVPVQISLKPELFYGISQFYLQAMIIKSSRYSIKRSVFKLSKCFRELFSPNLLQKPSTVQHFSYRN